jgi:hypothetical protein
MKNSTKISLAFSLLALLGACGDDKDSDVKDAGPPVIIPVVDSGTTPATPGTDAGTTPVTPTTDSGTTPVTPGTDGGTTPVGPGACFNGTPVKMEDFLNRCTSAATATKTLAVPAALLNADGTVKPF